MGEFAEYSWQGYLRGGMPYNPNYVPKKRPRCSCICCGKQVEASEGLREHWAMKHKLKRKFFRDPIAAEDFEKITSNREAREQVK